MEFIENIFNYFQNINNETLIDIGIALAIILVFKIISPFIAYIFIKMFNLKNKKSIKDNAFYKPLKAFLLSLGIYIGLIILKLPENIILIVQKIFKICIVLFVAKGFSNLCNISPENYDKIREKFHFHGNDTLINLLSKFLKIIVYIIAGFIIIKELGYDLSGLVAGLGISSVVIALAAQDFAKNILGGFTILTDKPFNIGDFITIDVFSGTVEDITLRSTRIRDAQNQIVVIPNSEIVSGYLVNSSKLEKRRYQKTLILDFETPISKVENAVQTIRLSLNTNENIIKDSMKVHFSNISEQGLEILIDFFADITDYAQFLEFQEAVNYAVIEIIKNENIQFAKCVFKRS